MNGAKIPAKDRMLSTPELIEGRMRACDRLDVNKQVRGLMGVPRASFPSAEETREVTGM